MYVLKAAAFVILFAEAEIKVFLLPSWRKVFSKALGT